MRGLTRAHVPPDEVTASRRRHADELLDSSVEVAVVGLGGVQLETAYMQPDCYYLLSNAKNVAVPETTAL